jgi:hypothetical protein
MRFRDGSHKTRNYENLGFTVGFFNERICQYADHLRAIATMLQKDFKELKQDLKDGNIDPATYKEFLIRFMPYFKDNPAPHLKELGANEILEEFEKLGIVWN